MQLRAAGALDEKLPAEAREQLQIAALHQLREFLRGTYDDSFKRSAFELLLAGHAQAMRRIGLAERVVRVVAKKGGGSNWHKVLTTEIAEARKSMTAVDHARLVILADEWHAIFKSGFPLNDRCFDLIDLPDRTLPSGAILNGRALLGPTSAGPTLSAQSFAMPILKVQSCLGRVWMVQEWSLHILRVPI